MRVIVYEFFILIVGGEEGKDYPRSVANTIN